MSEIEVAARVVSMTERDQQANILRGLRTTRYESWVFSLLCCVPMIFARIQVLLYPLQLTDFICYWAAGNLYDHGGKPYSLTSQLVVQRQLGWPLMYPFPLMSPPWSLPFIGLMSLPSFHTARMLWFSVCLALNFLAAYLLWKYFGGETKKVWISFVATLTFLPMAWADYYCQISPLMLVGLASFLLLLRRERYWLAGVATLLLGFKPHLLYLFFLALLFWIVTNRRWSILGGAFAGYTTFTLLAWIFNQHALDYLTVTSGAAMQIDCGLGGALRLLLGPQHTWLQWVPTLFGFIWFPIYWRKHRQGWDWNQRLPLILAVSVGTAPYYWAHDFILIFPVIIQLAKEGKWENFYVILGYFSVQFFVFGALHLAEPWLSAMSLLWIPFVLLSGRTSITGDAASLCDA
jgi:hypothetical protein